MVSIYFYFLVSLLKKKISCFLLIYHLYFVAPMKQLGSIIRKEPLASW